MVPSTLADWTYERIAMLCTVGQPEGDRHDFKYNLVDQKSLTKLCCAFANTFGGFVIIGVKDNKRDHFDAIGIDPDKELYGNFVAKVKADPDVPVLFPKTITVPSSTKLLYVFEISQSPRRPHLPTPADQRVFWKRQGSLCAQMTLEEIRLQMNSYEEKREKLALLLIDLSHKVRSIAEQATMAENYFNGSMFSFEIFDRVVADSFAILAADVNSIGALDTIRKQLETLNAVKQRMLSIQALSYDESFKNAHINGYRETVQRMQPGIVVLAEQIERSFLEKFGIENPYKIRNS